MTWKSKLLVLLFIAALPMASRAGEWQKMEGAEELERFVRCFWPQESNPNLDLASGEASMVSP